MKYFLDTEFNGFGGALISLALVREDGKSFYSVTHPESWGKLDPWVAANVVPILDTVPPHVPIHTFMGTDLAHAIATFFLGDKLPVIITDWPDDIRYFCEAIITGPGEMAALPGLTFIMRRVNVYPTMLADAVRHNAWWDAQALRQVERKNSQTTNP